MNYAVESFTGIRPTADLTVANYIGAVQPILAEEAAGGDTAIFLAELHAATTNKPAEVARHASELTRTLIASGVQGEIYSQRQIGDLVAQAEVSLRGLTTVARLLRLPTLKEKVMQSDNPENANVGLAMYPMMMAADIVLARPKVVPTGKDQKPHLEITNELIRAFNREYDGELPVPVMREVTPPNIMSLDGSGRKMSKSYPKGAIFLDDTPEIGRKKIMKAVTSASVDEAMIGAVTNMTDIAAGLAGAHHPSVEDIRAVGTDILGGERRMGEFKEQVGAVVVDFLVDMQARRAAVTDGEITERVRNGSDWFRPIGEETLNHIQTAYWG